MTQNEAVDQWKRGAKRALEVVRHLIDAKDYEYALFTCHLAVEKALKGGFVQRHNEVPPKVHNLILLAKQLGLDLSSEERTDLGELNGFSELGRYGDETWIEAEATQENAVHWLERATVLTDRFLS